MATSKATVGNSTTLANTGLEKVIRIDLIPAGRGVLHCFSHGEFIAKDELAACRALAERGVAGLVETWRERESYPSMRIDIVAGSKLSVSETQKCGPRFAPYRAFPTDKRLPVNPQETQTDLSAGGMHPSQKENSPPVM